MRLEISFSRAYFHTTSLAFLVRRGNARIVINVRNIRVRSTLFRITAHDAVRLVVHLNHHVGIEAERVIGLRNPI